MPLCFMLGRKGKGGGVAGVGGMGCVYQALFLSPNLGISFILIPCDLQIGALVAGALIHLVWCHVCVQPPGRGRVCTSGHPAPLASAPGMLTVVSSMVLAWCLMVSSGDEPSRRRHPTHKEYHLPQNACASALVVPCAIYSRTRWRPAVVRLQLETEPKEMGLDCSRWG